MAGRGSKFKKYYEDQKETMSITESIETTLGTGHRLANLAVAPILPNFENSPLITGPPDKLVLDLLNLPSLHMLIGVVDKHIKEIEKKSVLNF